MSDYKVKLKIIIGVSIAISVFINTYRASADTIVTNQNSTVTSQPLIQKTDSDKVIENDSVIEKMPSSSLDKSINSKVSTSDLSNPKLEPNETVKNDQTNVVSNSSLLPVTGQVTNPVEKENQFSTVKLTSVVEKPQLSYSAHVENIG